MSQSQVEVLKLLLNKTVINNKFLNLQTYYYIAHTELHNNRVPPSVFKDNPDVGECSVRTLTSVESNPTLLIAVQN